MAGYFKRRTKSGPSKNELKVNRGREAAYRARSAGMLKEQFPSVQHLSAHLEFIGPEHQTFDRQSRDFRPSDSCDFSVPCPGRCGSGAFDLEAKIRSVVEGRQTASESSGVCQEPLYAGSTAVCGFQLKCRIEASYFPEPDPVPVPEPPVQQP